MPMGSSQSRETRRQEQGAARSGHGQADGTLAAGLWAEPGAGSGLWALYRLLPTPEPSWLQKGQTSVGAGGAQAGRGTQNSAQPSCPHPHHQGVRSAHPTPGKALICSHLSHSHHCSLGPSHQGRGESAHREPALQQRPPPPAPKDRSQFPG